MQKPMYDQDKYNGLVEVEEDFGEHPPLSLNKSLKKYIYTLE
jgi:hypothetical protein